MAKATTIKEALARWEEKSGQKASEAKEVKLYGQVPPVEKMDGALSALVNCESVFGVYQLNGKFMIHSKIYEKKRRFEQDFQKEINIHAFDKARHQKIIQYVMKLSLSTNCIDRIANLNNLKNLRILSLGRNNIKNLNGLEAVAETLEELWISYNLIEKLRGIRVMKKLKVLYMSNNLVKDWAEFVRLAEVPALEELVFVGNPLQEKFATDQSSWIEEATKRVPKLKKLDGTLVVKGEEEEGAEGAEGTEGAEGGN